MSFDRKKYVVNNDNFILYFVAGGKQYKNDMKTLNLPEFIPGINQDEMMVTYLKTENDSNNYSFKTLPQNPIRQTQHAQKGGICGIAASKQCITRYGFFASDDERTLEIKISSYKRNSTQMTIHHAQQNQYKEFFYEQFDNMPDESTLENEDSEKIFAEHLLNNKFLMTNHPEFGELLKEFLNNKINDFDYFLVEKQAKESIEISMKAAKNFDFDIDQQAIKYFIEAHPETKFDDLDIDTKSSYYSRVLLEHIWELQGYKKTMWTPEQGMQALVDKIKLGPALVEIDYDGLQSHPTNSNNISTEIEKEYYIHDVFQGEKSETDESHIITIIGVDAKNGHVYFLDTNDESKPDVPRIVHRIDANLFCDILYNAHGIKLKDAKNPAPTLFILSGKNNELQNKTEKEVSLPPIDDIEKNQETDDADRPNKRLKHF